ncbi:hypothetical protein N7470_001827 [Penicillium chermesinum]|nr:hypothetical protein N7470_001827 [Penicillium chermesinum]
MSSIEHAYHDIAHQLGITGFDPRKEDVRVIVQRYLSQVYHGRWLLIFDNLDDLSIWQDDTSGSAEKGLREILPHSHRGTVLFTTRSNKIANFLAREHVVHITEMDEQKATRMFSNALIDKTILSDKIATQTLLDRLTFLPLAISQAASFINENNMEIARYLKLLDGQEQDAIELLSEDFEDEGRYKSAKNPVATTWLTSFMQIRKLNRLAADYLSFIACISHIEIPVLILPQASSLEREKAIGLLSSYSFIRVCQDGSYITMHRLVHLATRNWVMSTNTLRDWQKFALTVVRGQFPAIKHTPRKELQAWLPHARRIISLTSQGPESRERADLLHYVAMCYRFQGKYEAAKGYSLQALELLEKMCDEDDLAIFEFRYDLASIYQGLGDFEKSTCLTKQLLDTQKRVNGPNDPLFMDLQIKLASLHRHKSELKEAEELCKPAVRFFVLNSGLEDERLTNAIGELTMIYLSQGRLHDTLQLAEFHLDHCRRTRGEDDEWSLHAMVALGDLYFDLWKLNKAEAVYVEALERGKRIVGPDHPFVLRSMDSLALLFKSQGRHSEAESLMAECVHLRKKVMPHHQDTLEACQTLEEWRNPK